MRFSPGTPACPVVPVERDASGKHHPKGGDGTPVIINSVFPVFFRACSVGTKIINVKRLYCFSVKRKSKIEKRGQIYFLFSGQGLGIHELPSHYADSFA